METAPIDVVFTWVDDRFPGYLDLLNTHSQDRRDLNPNRTRDNLDLLRYAMRSVWRYLPQTRRVYLFTCRPQVPPWLDPDHPKIRLVHHDAVMDPAILPTFSSFAIVSHLHLLPDLSPQFLYFEDDILANAPDLLDHLRGEDGRPVVHLGRHRIAPQRNLNPARSSPWNLALAHADAVLSADFAPGPRRHVIHGPQLFDRQIMADAIAAYPALFQATRAARFRSGDAVPPEVFIPHWAIETGRATQATPQESRRVEGYVSLENLLPLTWARLVMTERRGPKSFALNDSFGPRPNPRVETLVRGWLNRLFPDPAPWEKSL